MSPSSTTPPLPDAIARSAGRVNNATAHGGRAVDRAAATGQASLTASFSDIDLMASTLRSHATFVHSQVARVAQAASDADLVASLPLSPLTGAVAEHAILAVAARLTAHASAAETLAIVSATIVTTYQLADNALQLAAVSLNASSAVVGAVGAGVGDVADGYVKTAASAEILGWSAIVLVGVAIGAAASGFALEGARSLGAAFQRTVDDYSTHPELGVGGLGGFVGLAVAAAATGFSTRSAWANSVGIVQGAIGATDPLYDDLLEGLIANGHNLGFFNDGRAELRDSGLSASSRAKRANQSLRNSSLALLGPHESLVGDANFNIVPFDLPSLFASARQIDDIGAKNFADIRVVKSADGKGSVTYIVQIPSTQPWNVIAGSAPNDATSDLFAMRYGDQTALAQAVLASMEAAGIPQGPGAPPVMLAGFSLGGITAAALAADPSIGYNIRHVLTAGAPIARMQIPTSVHVTAFEAVQDVVPSLDGARNPDSWNTVRQNAARLLSDATSDHSPASAHDALRYAVMARLNPQIDADPQIAQFFNGSQSVKDYVAFREHAQ